MLIAVDFDGTIVTHDYPQIGKELPFATATLRQLIQDGHRLILWTQREGDLLKEAVSWCSEKGVEFYAVNKNFPEETPDMGEPRKIKFDLIIDDRNVGGLPDWGVIYSIISHRVTFQDYLLSHIGEQQPKKKKHWWQ